MGCCFAAPKGRQQGHQGNLLVDGFLRYTTGTAGWTRVKTTIRNLTVEEYSADEPLGTWRGVAYLDSVTLAEVVPYVREKLGVDDFELIEDNDQESVFRDTFDFQKYSEIGKMLPVVTGDHRGEAVERMEERQSTLQLSKLGVRGRKTGGITRQLSQPLPAVSEEREGSKDSTREANTGQGDSDDEDEDGAAGNNGSFNSASPYKLGKSDSNVGDGEPMSPEDRVPAAALTNGEDTGSSRRSAAWMRLFGKSGSSFSKKTVDELNNSFPVKREIVFRRQDFELGEGNRHVVICESTRYKETAKNVVRCELHMMGALIEDATEKKKRRVKITFVISLDPLLDKSDVAKASEEALSAFGGKSRVLNFLCSARDFYASDSSRLVQKFRTVASATTGEFGWEDIERSKNELQLGTNVQHPKLGHGIVHSFDMKGRVRVIYDSGEAVDHLPEEKEDLRVSVQMGTRVSHPERGMGTVKQFDEMGRVHVKFDNGEYHRYKQAAWKKKMHTYRLMGIGGALGTVKLSWRPFEESKVREGQGRVKFAVGVSTAEVLEFVLDYKEDVKSGNIIERRVVEKLNENERIIYEHRKMPDPISPRDFVLKEIYREVAPNTYVVVFESVVRPDIPEKPGIVRGEIFLSGYLLEPLYLSEETYDGDDHIARVTFQLCVDIKGFIHPNAVAAVRQSQLLGVLTDIRQNFWKQSERKAKAKVLGGGSSNGNRKSKRLSQLGNAPSVGGVDGALSSVKSILGL